MAKKTKRTPNRGPGAPRRLHPGSKATTITLEPHQREAVIDWQHRHRLPTFVDALRAMLEFAHDKDPARRGQKP